MLQQLKDIVSKTKPRALGVVLSSKINLSLYNWLIDETSELSNVTIVERVYYLLNGKPNAYCTVGNKKTFKPKTKQYGFCNSPEKCQCAREHLSNNYKPRDMTIVAEKRKETWLKKYGVDNASKSDIIKEKRKQTMADRDYSHVYNQLAYKSNPTCQ